jgi:hypothetical protein
MKLSMGTDQLIISPAVILFDAAPTPSSPRPLVTSRPPFSTPFPAILTLN